MVFIGLTDRDYKIGLRKAKDDLGDFLDSTKKILGVKSKTRIETDAIYDSLDHFVGMYYALFDLAENTDLVASSGSRSQVLMNFSLSYAGTTALNTLEDRLSSNLLFHNDNFATNVINPDKLQGISEYSLLSSALGWLRRYVSGSSSGKPSIKTALFMGNLEQAAAHQAARLSNGRELSSLNLAQVTYSGDTINLVRNKRNLNGVSGVKFKNADSMAQNNGHDNGSPETNPRLEGDILPEVLPSYEPPNVSLDDVVGNTNQLDFLKECVLKMLHYDPSEDRNYFWKDGNGFPEGVLLYGKPGCGKTFMTDAIMSFASSLGEMHSLDFMPVSIDGHSISSVYSNRSARLLEHYFSMLRSGDSSYLVKIDEFDDLIPMGRNGEMSENARQRLSSFKRSTGNSSAKGNYFIIAISNNVSSERDIPASVTSRFRPLYVPGPSTPEEYGMIFMNGLKEKASIGLLDKVDWTAVGSHLMEWKSDLSEHGSDLGIGRGYKVALQQLASTVKGSINSYSSQTLGRPYSFHERFYRSRLAKVSQDDIHKSIDVAMNSLLQRQRYSASGCVR